LVGVYNGTFSTTGIYRAVPAQEINPIPIIYSTFYRQMAEQGFKPRSFRCPIKQIQPLGYGGGPLSYIN